MLEKNGGVKGYAKDIKKYRKGRETHRKRQISFAKKNVEMEDKMVRAPPPALEQPCSSTAEEEDAIFTPKAAKKQKRTSREEEEERDANELRDEFSRALCGSHGCFTPMSFVEDPDNAAEEESMCLGKRWKMFVECKELCDLFFSPFHDKSDTAFSIHHHSTAQMWAMAITNFAMKRHMTKIMDLVNKRSPLKLDAKRMLVVEETRDLCTVMSMWWRGMDSRAEHVVSLWNLFSTVGDVRRDAKIMYAVVSADDMYHASMEVLTRKVIRNGGGGGGGSNVEAEFIRALDNEEGYLGCVVKLRNTLRGVLHTDS